MQTVSVNVMTLCTPCENRCRYCLLSYNGKTVGANYERSKQYAVRFYNWLKQNRPELSFVFGFGYSMEHPNLFEEIKFLQSINSPTGEFLQFDGMKFREKDELRRFLTKLKDYGIKLIDLTFYGDRDYHDRFAAREGDFDYMVSVAKIADEIGLKFQIGIAITSENAKQVDGLVDFFSALNAEKIFIFVPHSEGRGITIEDIRFDSKSFEKLGERARSKFNSTKFKTEKDWVECKYDKPSKRMISLSLTNENIDYFEGISFSEAIEYVERLDDEYYNAVPDFSELVKIYGDKNSDKFYSLRDLYLKYQRLYIEDNKLNVCDVNDERLCFSRRF